MQYPSLEGKLNLDTWKKFEKMLSHSAVHHLVTIAELLEEHGYARVSDVSRRLEITRGSASITLKRLKERGLVTEDKRRFLGLSESGQQIAHSVQMKKKIMMTLFKDFLGVDATQADQDTCKIEHLISAETADRAARLLRFIESAPPVVKDFIQALEQFEKLSQDNHSLHLIDAQIEKKD